MKLLTLNTHSLVEEHYRRKLEDFLTATAREAPDILALQEVSQHQSRAIIDAARLMDTNYVPCAPQIPIRRGNHALSVAEGLRGLGISYFWTWLPVKRGYGIYDEGVAVFSRTPIAQTDILTVSSVRDYTNWKVRRLLGAQTNGIWFYSVHLGWWDDPEEPFAIQWARVNRHMADRGRVFLMGDFNSPAEVRDAGYDQMIRDGWQDTFTLAVHHDNGRTVSGKIAGWTTRDLPAGGARVDHILTNRPCTVISSQVIFNGEKDPTVSDHFGVLTEISED